MVDRRVALEGSFNFRDLGGYPTVDGAQTRPGRLYRSDGLQQLTGDDVAELRRRGLATIVDLRTEEELARWGRGPLEAEPIRWEHLSIITNADGEAVAAPATDDLAARYLWYLQVGGPAVIRALRILADPEGGPAVFHCAAGKDRTGVLAALILSAVGVERAAVVADYTDTQANLAPILERLAANPPPGHVPAPPSRLTVDPGTMERFLAGMDEHHGGAARWMATAGGDPDLPDRLRAVLVG